MVTEPGNEDVGKTKKKMLLRTLVAFGVDCR